MRLLSLLAWLIHGRQLLRGLPLLLFAASLQAAMPVPAEPAETAVRTVKVGVYANAPKYFLDKNGQLSGILGDVLVAMAQQAHWQLVPMPCEWQACLQVLQAGQIDLMPDVALTEQRTKIFDFHQTSALQSWSQIYKRKGSAINAIPDLRDKRIAVVAGSVQASYLETMLSSFAIPAQLVPGCSGCQPVFWRLAGADLPA